MRRIELALTAREVSATASAPPGDMFICKPLTGLPVSYRESPRRVAGSGTQRGRGWRLLPASIEVGSTTVGVRNRASARASVAAMVAVSLLGSTGWRREVRLVRSAGQFPTVPSMRSLIRSAWPLSRAYSSTMCWYTHRNEVGPTSRGWSSATQCGIATTSFSS